MALVNKMFPSKFLQPEDLPQGVTTVTIEWVKLLAVRTNQQNNTGEVESEWQMKLREYPKPMKLKALVARTIADVLGNQDTDAWVGQSIGIYPVQIMAYGKPMLVINADVHKPYAQPRIAPAAASKEEKSLRIPSIGVDAGERWLQRLKEFKKNPTHFLNWLISKNPAMGADLADRVKAGAQPREWPRSTYAQLMKGFLDDCADEAAGQQDVVDLTTGEVVGTAPVEEITEDDIPF